MSKYRPMLYLLCVAFIILASCTHALGGIPDNAALSITGNVTKPIGWSEKDVLKMDSVEVESENKDGEIKTYTGVKINNLLALTELSSGATTLEFIGEDGATAEIALAELQGCDDCIISFRSQGGFSVVLPGFPGKLQIKGVMELKVK